MWIGRLGAIPRRLLAELQRQLQENPCKGGAQGKQSVERQPDEQVISIHQICGPVVAADRSQDATGSNELRRSRLAIARQEFVIKRQTAGCWASPRTTPAAPCAKFALGGTTYIPDLRKRQLLSFSEFEALRSRGRRGSSLSALVNVVRLAFSARRFKRAANGSGFPLT